MTAVDDSTPLEVVRLAKRYGDLVAVDGVEFRAEAGTIFGLLGPNGAGKSTTIGCISGLVAPTSGAVRVFGFDVVAEPVPARRRLGVVPQELALYDELSATANLEYWGGAYGLGGEGLRARVRELLAALGLLDRASEPVKNFSGGMKRRLNFGCGIVHRPDVLLLDEPTVGVDPQSRVALLDLVRAEAARGACVVYTTHYMEEAQELCDRLAIIDRGRLIAQGTLDELRSLHDDRDLLRLVGHFDPEPVHAACAALEGISVTSAEPTTLLLSIRDGSRRLPDVYRAVADTGGEVHETTLTRPSLESLFIRLTGRALRE